MTRLIHKIGRSRAAEGRLQTGGRRAPGEARTPSRSCEASLVGTLARAMVDKLEGQLLHGGTIGPRTWRFGVTTGGDSKAKEMNGKVPQGIPKSINDDVAVAQEEAKARRQDVEGCPGAHVQYRNRLRQRKEDGRRGLDWVSRVTA